VRKEISRLVAEEFLSLEQADVVDAGKVAAFFQTEIGKRIRCGTTILREFKFTILEDAVTWDEHLKGEQILLQGVVDCALVEPDGITIVDFKTDRVTEENLAVSVQRYQVQVRTYADAMQRIYQLPVKACYLYFFRLGKLIAVSSVSDAKREADAYGLTLAKPGQDATLETQTEYIDNVSKATSLIRTNRVEDEAAMAEYNAKREILGLKAKSLGQYYSEKHEDGASYATYLTGIMDGSKPVIDVLNGSVDRSRIYGVHLQKNGKNFKFKVDETISKSEDYELWEYLNNLPIT
jgi:hypothetical protein